MFLKVSDVVDMILFVSEAKLSEDSSEWNPRVCVCVFVFVFFNLDVYNDWFKF